MRPLNVIALVISLLFLASCAPKEEKKKSKPCFKGVNQKVCGPQVNEITEWTTISVYSEQIEVESSYKFFPGKKGQAPRMTRELSVLNRESGELKRMIESGEITAIDTNSFTWVKLQSSCASDISHAASTEDFIQPLGELDEPAAAKRIYYKRADGRLEIQPRPFLKPKKSKGISGAMANAIAGAITETLAEAIRDGLIMTFTLGSARQLFDQFDESLVQPRRSLEDHAADLEKTSIGCFAGLGNGFQKTHISQYDGVEGESEATQIESEDGEEESSWWPW